MTTNWMTKMAAAAVTLAGTVALAASAATATVEIPFGFQAHKKAMPGGTYQVSVDSRDGSKVMTIRNGKDNVIFGVMQTGEAKTDTNKVLLTFVCSDPGCTLASAKTGSGVYSVPMRKMTPAEQEKMYTVTIPAKVAGSVAD